MPVYVGRRRTNTRSPGVTMMMESAVNRKLSRIIILLRLCACLRSGFSVPYRTANGGVAWWWFWYMNCGWDVGVVRTVLYRGWFIISWWKAMERNWTFFSTRCSVMVLMHINHLFVPLTGTAVNRFVLVAR